MAKEMKKPYRIGFVKSTEPIEKGFPFIVDRIEFLGNDKVVLKTSLTTKILKVNNISDGIIMVETKNTCYIVYDHSSDVSPLWLNTHPLNSCPIDAKKLDCDYNYNPPKLIKKASINNQTIENYELLPIGVFEIFTTKGDILFGI